MMALPPIQHPPQTKVYATTAKVVQLLADHGIKATVQEGANVERATFTVSLEVDQAEMALKARRARSKAATKTAFTGAAVIASGAVGAAGMFVWLISEIFKR